MVENDQDEQTLTLTNNIYYTALDLCSSPENETSLTKETPPIEKSDVHFEKEESNEVNESVVNTFYDRGISRNKLMFNNP